MVYDAKMISKKIICGELFRKKSWSTDKKTHIMYCKAHIKYSKPAEPFEEFTGESVWETTFSARALEALG